MKDECKQLLQEIYELTGMQDFSNDQLHLTARIGLVGDPKTEAAGRLAAIAKYVREALEIKVKDE